MSFHNVSLPDGFEFGSAFGGGFTTVVQETSTGHEVRLARQSQVRHRYRLRKELQTQDEALALKTFALGRRGALHSFRLKDWSDYTTATNGTAAPTMLDQVIGVGDGSETQFQMTKTYDVSGDEPYVRVIELPVAGTIVAAVAGVSAGATITNPGGLVTLSAAPTLGQIVTAGCQFQVPARFGAETDAWNALQADAFEVWSLQQLECIEVLGEVAWPELWNPGGATDHGSVSQSFAISYGEGLLHRCSPTTAVDMFLPAPDRMVGGHRHFVIVVEVGAAGSVQVRDDAGVAVGSALSAGDRAQLACSVVGSSFSWVIY